LSKWLLSGTKLTLQFLSGEKYRKLQDVSAEEQLMMCGIFKQATMGDCEVDGE